LAFPARSKKERVITDGGYDSDPLRFRLRL
jgi:hypothetical protein